MTTASYTTAQIILNQLGGRKFVAMTGANALCDLISGIQFRFKGARGMNSVRIEIDAEDTYTVSFFNVRGLNCAPAGEYTGVYDSQLASLFSRKTGLEVSL